MHAAGPPRDLPDFDRGVSRNREASDFAFFVGASPSNQIRKETGRG